MSTNKAMATKLEDLERQDRALGPAAGLRSQYKNTDIDCKREITAVIGNMDGIDSFLEAKEWVEQKLASMTGPTPSEVYCKGEYTNIVFIEFSDTTERDTAVALFRSANYTISGKKIWATQDRPPALRAARNFCFGLKYILRDMMNVEYTIKVIDSSPLQVFVGGELAITVNFSEQGLEYSWTKEWEEWEDLQNNTQLKDLKQACDDLGLRPVPETAGTGAGCEPNSCSKYDADIGARLGKATLVPASSAVSPTSSPRTAPPSTAPPKTSTSGRASGQRNGGADVLLHPQTSDRFVPPVLHPQGFGHEGGHSDITDKVADSLSDGVNTRHSLSGSGRWKQTVPGKWGCKKRTCRPLEHQVVAAWNVQGLGTDYGKLEQIFYHM
eukprot:9473697-Pyramimonas_sp.AAC.1